VATGARVTEYKIFRAWFIVLLLEIALAHTHLSNGPTLLRGTSPWAPKIALLEGVAAIAPPLPRGWQLGTFLIMLVASSSRLGYTHMCVAGASEVLVVLFPSRWGMGG